MDYMDFFQKPSSMLSLGAQKRGEVSLKTMVDRTTPQQVAHTPRGLKNHFILFPI